MTKSYHAGWDHFSPDPGKVKEMFCRVCKAKMDVQRNVNGPTGFAEAMGGGKHLHDSFSCPHAQEDWHNQARVLKQRIKDETSKSIAKILKKELKWVMENKKTTKKRYWKGL
jgi:hypothetical protein